MAFYSSMIYLCKRDSIKHAYFKMALLSLIFTLLASCNKNDKLEKEISKIPVTVRIERFDSAFAQVNQNTLPEIKRSILFYFLRNIRIAFGFKK